MMVAAALLQVMHARKMSRRTTVGMIAPQAHASLRQLTVHQLLSMTAPLTNGEKDNGPLDDAALAERVISGADLTVFDKRDTIFPIRMALTIWPDIFSSYWSASHFQTR
jgi:CubicO group peptidase (beta-lactamase class C family)